MEKEWACFLGIEFHRVGSTFISPQGRCNKGDFAIFSEYEWTAIKQILYYFERCQ